MKQPSKMSKEEYVALITNRIKGSMLERLKERYPTPSVASLLSSIEYGTGYADGIHDVITLISGLPEAPDVAPVATTGTGESSNVSPTPTQEGSESPAQQ